ncbi:hypothetical protein BDZ89DRAFT_979954 [Hymenopellis radicata]|nr:hypothetical protein BDZ89DRAFT_979954 [Hymenopellis radicata]
MATTVASSGTLWATASKEWVIQPKPKPGRKPKKDQTPVVNNDTDPDGKGRRVQNRAAQRAFRERKQSQLAELQARVQSYEQGEIERNVALQNIAKRLKEENEQLRQQNEKLKERLATTESERDAALASNKKRTRDESPASTSTHPRKKIRTFAASFQHSSTPEAYPSSSVSSPESNDTPDTPFSAADGDHNTEVSFPKLVDKAPFESFLPTFGCGYCSEDTSCVCREIAMQTDADPNSPFKLERFDDSSPVIHVASPTTTSILDNLPAYQPAVPLRRKPTSSHPRSIFPVAPLPTAAPACSGDPENCAACANDTFGKAFCAAINQSATSREPCAGCPCSQNDTLNSLRSTVKDSSPEEETISTDNAWRQLKSHPNVSFSDLTLLADVVARRSKCTGPRVVISPAPGSITPERMSSPGLDHGQASKDRGVVNRSPPPMLVPEEVLLRCGQKRMREVQAAGVRDALRLLDAKFS